MSLLNSFKRYFHPVDVYSLVKTIGNWGTEEKETYSKTATISCYIQPLSGSETLKNQSLDDVTTHRMYVAEGVVIGSKDRIFYGGKYYHISYNPPEGTVSNTGDHQEIGLILQR